MSPCTPFRTSDGKLAGFICSRGGRADRCAYCGRLASKLCDFKVAPGKTCDARICGQCSVHTELDHDVCRIHGIRGDKESE